MATGRPDLTHRLAFEVEGMPITQGSMVSTGYGRMRHSDPALDAWREKVGWMALKARPYGWPYDAREQPFSLHLTFWLTRPAYLPKRVLYPIRKRDLDKLLRAVMDALTGVLWKDDGQVIDIDIRKRFAVNRDPGVEVAVVQA